MSRQVINSGGGDTPPAPAAPPAAPPHPSPPPRRKTRRKSDLALQTSLLQQPTLIDELADLGFNAAADFIVQHDPARVQQAINRARSMKGIKNIPGFIRYLVRTPGPIPDPEKPKEDTDKYITGKYGHMVKR